MLTAPDREKLMRAGFHIFRRNKTLKTITECRGPVHGWYTVGRYKSQAEMNREMNTLLLSSFAIEDN